MVSKCCICKKKAWCFDNDGKTPYCKDCWDKTHKDLSLQCNCSDNECCSNCPEKLNNKMIKTLKDIEFERFMLKELFALHESKDDNNVKEEKNG